MSRPDLKTVVERLAEGGPPGLALTDPFRILLFETVGYLTDDRTRDGVLAELERRIGLEPRALAAASNVGLTEILRPGGMHPDKRAARIKEIARVVSEDCGGDLDQALRAAPAPAARRLLKSLPGVADPGADRILLFGGFEVVPALDSNGLRAMVRLGACVERPSYSTTYREAVAVLAAEGEINRDWLMRAYLVLRDHGRTLCRRSAPACLACPFDAGCAHAVIKAL